MAETNGNVRWQTWAAWAAVVLIVVAGGWNIYTGLQAEIDRARAEASSDREQLVRVCSALVEIETQFRAADQIRNLQHKDDVNHIAMLWQRVNKQDMPTADLYLPTIARDDPGVCR